MINRRSFGERIFNIFNIMFLTTVVVISLYPMTYVVFASVSKASELMSHSGILLKPQGLSLNAYIMVFKNPMIMRGYLNTIFVVVAGVGINILMTSFGAYFLSRKNVLWKDIIMFLIVFTMFFNGGLIPFYFTVKQLGLINTLWSLILPVAVNAFYIIMMRTSFMAIPDSMEQSAKLDGANDFMILFYIILPLSLPVVAVMFLFYGVGHWNAWFHAAIFIRERELYPIQLVLREILIQNDTESMLTQVSSMDKESVGETIKHATIVIATIPILFAYPFLQKYFVNGVMIGAIKG